MSQKHEGSDFRIEPSFFSITFLIFAGTFIFILWSNLKVPEPGLKMWLELFLLFLGMLCCGFGLGAMDELKKQTTKPQSEFRRLGAKPLSPAKTSVTKQPVKAPVKIVGPGSLSLAPLFASKSKPKTTVAQKQPEKPVTPIVPPKKATPSYSSCESYSSYEPTTVDSGSSPSSYSSHSYDADEKTSPSDAEEEDDDPDVHDGGFCGPKYRTCTDCDRTRDFDCTKGNGKCADCHGSGHNRDFMDDVSDVIADMIGGENDDTCSTCNGSGECQTCNGEGTLDV